MPTKLDPQHLAFATHRLGKSLWVIAYTIIDGEAHVFSYSRDPEWAGEDFARRWPTMEPRTFGGVLEKFEVASRGGSCVWTVANPRDRFEYDAGALVALVIAGEAVTR